MKHRGKSELWMSRNNELLVNAVRGMQKPQLVHMRNIHNTDSPEGMPGRCPGSGCWARTFGSAIVERTLTCNGSGGAQRAATCKQASKAGRAIRPPSRHQRTQARPCGANAPARTSSGHVVRARRDPQPRPCSRHGLEGVSP